MAASHLMTFTVDGFLGAGVEVSALVINNVVNFSYDNESQMLKLLDDQGKVTNIALTDQATWTVTAVSFYLTTVVIAD